MWFAGNVASGGLAGATTLIFTYSLDFARTRLANNIKAANVGGDRQFKGLVDVYRKTVATDGVAGLYHGFGMACAGIVVYRGLYFGLYDSIRPAMSTELQNSYSANFALGFIVTVVAGKTS